MNKIIKKFIEDNIDAIQNGQWYKLIIKWYSDIAIYFDYTDEWFDELVAVFNKANIDFLKDSFISRGIFMRGLLEQNIEQEIDSMIEKDADSFPKMHIMIPIDSYLGFTNDEMYDMADGIAKMHDLIVENKVYRRVR